MEKCIGKIILQKGNTVGGITLSDIMNYYTATLIIIVWYYQRIRNIDQWSRRENQEIDPHKCDQLIFYKAARPSQCSVNQWEKKNFSKLC